MIQSQTASTSQQNNNNNNIIIIRSLCFAGSERILVVVVQCDFFAALQTLRPLLALITLQNTHHIPI